MCRTTKLLSSLTGRFESGPYIYSYVHQQFWRFDTKGGRVWVRSLATCTQGGVEISRSIRWVLVADPDPEGAGGGVV